MEDKDLEKEMDDMADVLEDDTIPEPDLEPEEPDEPEEPTGSSTDAPTTDAPAEDLRDVKMKEMEIEIEKLKNPEPESTDVPTTDAPIEDVNFLGDLTMEDMTEEKLNEVLNKVFKEGLAAGKSYSKKEIESVRGAIPIIAQSAKDTQDKLKEIKDKFYKDNEDLSQWKSAVGAVFTELSEANPDKSYEEILPGVADEVRKRLNLGEIKKDKPEDDKPPPSPKSGKRGKRRSSGSSKSGFDKESDEMDKALES